MQTSIPFGETQINIELPDEVDILSMKAPSAIADPLSAIEAAMDKPLGTDPLEVIIKRKRRECKSPRAVIVISDNTRPVPYRGENGILWPLVKRLIDGGINTGDITVLIATGMHRGLNKDELKKMIDPRLFAAGITMVNHDSREAENLCYLGKTGRGSEVYINKLYMESEIKILTGLVESHFMAGASGGRKSICPGLIGEESTKIFHGAEMMADPDSTDLKLEGNPCHEEALEVASKAGADFILNVTLDHKFNVTGVFGGDLKIAHEAAVEHLKSYTALTFQGEYDIVISHAGFVGINHYQVAKAGTVAARIVRPGGYVLMVADNKDTDSIGSLEYRTVLQLLTLNGPEAVDRLLKSPDWVFIPEQWQVQMWNRLFRKIPFDHFFYYSPQFGKQEYQLIPGEPFERSEGLEGGEDPDNMIPSLIKRKIRQLQSIVGREARIAFLKDGPYGIPL